MSGSNVYLIKGMILANAEGRVYNIDIYGLKITFSCIHDCRPCSTSTGSIYKPCCKHNHIMYDNI